ncbi:NAD(P)H-dependent oxidoreductase [Acidisoma cellulosilytica]|uniref:NAD(P)H-dependent oxidoreductase n=1 Tax=Acidisoma cellulosilyticum TaxID=2802395 RepID=A0A963Z297_9PROT|nr:NADPH-dependent FMN reductase [Acidisoma cellulosilyticum]MCB8880632.1 NAD(P)H-dependent oxidoreductase [Acidisoma cellulosilyticum]
MTLTITGIAGSLRAASTARILLEGMASLLPSGSDYAAIDIGALPHYNQDLDDERGPGSVASARARIFASDAVLIVTPEFNHSLPGVLKNALDWLSRPAFKSGFIGKPVLFATVSPGPLGGVRAQAAMRDTLSAMLCRLPPYKELVVGTVGGKITDGKLTDAVTVAHFSQALDRFLAEIAGVQ